MSLCKTLILSEQHKIKLWNTQHCVGNETGIEQHVFKNAVSILVTETYK
jgi:hypothetical protein